MEEGKMQTDILGMDLIYDDNKGEVNLGMRSYIEKLKDQYPKIINEQMKQEKIPHIYEYDINPKEELTIGEDEYKQKVKYLRELNGRLNYIRSRGRLGIEFAVSKVARLTLNPHKGNKSN